MMTSMSHGFSAANDSRVGACVLSPRDQPAVQLREHLQHDLAAGLDFASAWRASVAAVVCRLPAPDARRWTRAFDGTRAAWAAAYEAISQIDRLVSA